MNKYSALSILLMSGGALPVTATLLVLAASMLAAGLVAYFLFEYNRRALQQPSLAVLWAVAYASEGGVELYLAVENTGGVPVNLDNSIVVLPLNEGRVELKLAKGGGVLMPGERATLVYRGAADFNDVLEGGLATLIAGNCQASFPVAKP